MSRLCVVSWHFHPSTPHFPQTLLVFFFKCVHFVILSIYAKAGKKDQNYSSDPKVPNPCVARAAS